MRRAMAVLGLAASAAVAAAQPPPATPSPEHKKLQYFAGKWNIDGEMKSTPMGPGGKMTASETCEWFATAGFHLVCNSSGTNPLGPTRGLSILGYSTETKGYTFYGIDRTGWADSAKGSLEGDTWTWTSEGTMGGQSLKSRYIIKELTPDSYTFRAELSVAGGPFTLMFEGKQTRAK